jgi:hypothetical protein
MAPPLTSAWAQPDPNAPPPSVLAPVSELGGQLPASAAQPISPAPKSPMEQQIGSDQQRLEKVRWEQQNPWGTPENHPGKLGKLAHVFSSLGNIAGDIFAPGVMANIPGTQMNRNMQEGGLAKRLNAEIGDESTNAYRDAETGKTEAETPQIAPDAESKRNLEGAQADEARNKIAQGPDLAQAYAHAVGQAIKNGTDPAQDPIVQHLSDAITSIQKQAAPKGKQHVNLQDASGKPMGGTFDEGSGKYYDASGKELSNPIPYEKPQVTNVNAANSEMDREATRLGKPYEKGISDANAQLDKIADARSMINGNAESQALGIPKVLTALVSGQGSGVRITQPELNAIATARGLSGDVEGTLNSWAGKGKLTSTQQQQLTQILDDVKNRILTKQAIHTAALDSINGASDRTQIIQADKLARKQLNEVEQHGFYTGQKLPQGTVVGFSANGKVQVDDAR